jgi:pyruvate formate lyase activating enzyme
MKRIGELFDTTPIRIDLPDGASVAYPENLTVYTHLGRPRPVRAIFRHPYQGQLLTIVPLLCPPITCTPEHEFLAIPKPKKGQPIPKPTFLPAAKLTREHCLAIPKRYTFSRDITLEVPQWLQTVVKPLSARKSDVRLRRRVVARTDKDELPKALQLDTRFAALLGYYCAEGCVVRDDHRPNAATLIFSFGHHERNLAERVCQWLRELFGVNPSIVKMPTTLQVAVNKSSLALLFEALCGAKSREKRIPPFLFEAKRDIVDAFVQAYAQGDGTVRPDGCIVVSTVSAELAYGLAWLLLKLGYLPSLRTYRQPTHSTVLGRPVRQAPNIFMVIWRNDNHWRFVWQDDDYYYVPIRQIVSQPFKGFVYNMQVDDEHTYLAQFVATHNCQNWQISQVMRDSVATMLADFTPITPEEFVKMALRYKAKVLTSTYNEPLITSEWAVALFREGKKFGLVGSYVSNGNATPEVLDYIRPVVDLFKIDLKSMREKNYRELGGKLETVLNTIRWAWERGFWVEVVTLVVPKFNDSEEELRDAARYIASVSPDIPWHVTAFHPDYLMTDRGATPVKTLIRAAEIGYEEGLKFVYAGNLPGMVGPYENTYCPKCHALLIERYGFQVRRYRIVDGKCPDCGEPIPGVWWKEEEVPHYLRR